ncbi:hypothetical protein Tco_0624013 [Tanacetum coccineum]|uniref:Reverse transcriptase domain-containing protein n=1 Tax=Tanacetum coccineum TaxID=301880 RepID=A0ABQ4WCR3_9ASTR
MKSSLKKTVAFVDEGSSNSDTDKIIARMDAMTMKMDAQYKEFQSRSKQPNPNHNDDDKPMSLEEQAKFMQTFHRSLPSSTQPNPKDSSSKPYQPPQARNEHVNAVFTRSGMPNYGKFLKELVSNKHKLEQISSAFFSEESSAMIQNKVLPKLGDPRSFLIPCNFSKAFSCNALADLDATLIYVIFAKLPNYLLKLSNLLK